MEISAEDAFEIFCRQDCLSPALDDNEANTRLRVIDTILLDVLHWDKKDFDVEKYRIALGDTHKPTLWLSPVSLRFFSSFAIFR